MTTPKIVPGAGTYPSGTPISIASSRLDSVIYFTLDGSPPSPESKRYRGPIHLGSETTANRVMRLRAIALSRDGRSSPVAAADYERATGIHIRFRKPDAWSSAYIYFWDTEPDGLSSQWPGAPMQWYGGDWCSVELPGQTSANLLFNDAGEAQTRDLSVNAPDAWFVGEERWEVDPARFDGFLFPGGVAKALVVSMDDGPVQDRRLVELLERRGIRGTFHLNSGRLGQPDHVSADEVASLYARHEVSSHSVNHPYLDSLSRPEITAEIHEDRSVLAQISGRAVRGHAYPFGAYNDEVLEVLRDQGIVYARTASQAYGFSLPADPLVWNPTCHHTRAGDLADSFIGLGEGVLSLFFVYGHSWELDAGEPKNNWAYMESLARKLGGRNDTWYAGAIEVADYVRAICSVQPSLAEDSLYNPGATDLWLRSGGAVVRLPAGGHAKAVLDWLRRGDCGGSPMRV